MCLQGTEPRLSLNRPTCSNLLFFLDTWNSILESFRLSGNSPNCWEILQAVYKFFRLSRNLQDCLKPFPDCPEIFHTDQKSSRLSGNLQDCLEIFKIVRKSSRLSGNFPDCPAHFPECKEIFQTIKKFPDCPGIFQTVWKSSSPSGNIQNLSWKAFILKYYMNRIFFGIFWKTFQMGKNFPGSNATLLPRFFSLCLTQGPHLVFICLGYINLTRNVHELLWRQYKKKNQHSIFGDST